MLEVEVAAATASAEEEEDDARGQDSKLNEKAEELISEPDVLERYVEDMADVHEVHENRAQMKVVMLGGSSAQLDLLPTNKPLGTNVILAGETGRGKNYATDAVADGVPDEWVYRFESASTKSFYYETEADPERFEHVWVYPNEAEATDQLVEILRPLLSGGKAEHKTVNKDADGSNVFREYKVKGPITVTIPTVRNKLDTQLQTRMIMTELEDFEGRVPEHSLKVSDTLLPEYAAKDHDEKLQAWKAALRKLTGVRKVVIPKRDVRFKFTSEEVSHGARLWRNFLSLALTNAWLEQRNRDKIDLPNGETAIVATAKDYRVVYEVFATACKRSLGEVSETHRRILNAVYELQEENGLDDKDTGYSYRKIAIQAGLSHQTVKNHKTYLTRSVVFLREVEGGGLRLVADAEPSWWTEGEMLQGFPRPEEVAEWWGDNEPDDDLDRERESSASESALPSLQDEDASHKPDIYQGNLVTPEGLQTSLHVKPEDDSGEDCDEQGLHVQPLSTFEVGREFALNKLNTQEMAPCQTCQRIPRAVDTSPPTRSCFGPSSTRRRNGSSVRPSTPYASTRMSSAILIWEIMPSNPYPTPSHTNVSVTRASGRKPYPS